ncbi:hypothetical protein WJ0W_007108 [Paenibacillus melissococcoides]|uniref:XRE family transcriptional regulator n=1 Tax=Paenibacillus melissococcoides TaxID=2912268 RepID=A0ABN8UHR6_9BACL|nr:hypothetical protein [Paenibacillus melissococcoides]CAH8249922.1 hypothetical protein WJ0W_007108 [Paenibacillus melissococcoides]
MKKRKLSPIGVTIKKRLAEMNMTQYELAAQVGTNKLYLPDYDWERRKKLHP